MPKRSYRLLLEDIRECATRVKEYVGKKPYKEFINDQMVVDAVARNLEIIGEASKKIPKEVKQKYNQIEWKKIAGLRDILIHEYSGINYEILWDIIQHHIPDLLSKIDDILKKS